LETYYHLSYPFVFQWDGDFFMMPETASRRQVELYRCVDFPARWKLERVVLRDLKALDPTPALLLGRWWLFANAPAYGAGSMDELHLFYSDSPLGPWTPHRDNPIKSDVRSARPAGRIFENHGEFYRPAQDCSTRYGSAVVINRILQLRSEEHTSELQSRFDLVCRLLLEKKNRSCPIAAALSRPACHLHPTARFSMSHRRAGTARRHLSQRLSAIQRALRRPPSDPHYLLG